MTQKRNPDAKDIEPGMVVEATQGDLGEEDVSKPKVTNVVQGENGDVEKVIVSKGVIFKKKIAIPADSIQSIDQESQDDTPAGKITVSTRRGEVAALAPTGEEALPKPGRQDGLLDQVEQELPTVEGLRELESSGNAVKDGDIAPENQEQQETMQPASPEKQPATPKKKNFLFSVLGPGFLAGMAGNDSSAVATYAVNGGTNGYGQLWLMLLSTPLYHTVQYTCAKIGHNTQQGLAEVLREHYGFWVAALASLVLIVANLALIAADLVAIGSGFELLTGLNWVWFIIPVSAILWYLTVYRSFETIKKIFIVMSLAFVSYLVTALFSKANWGAVLFNTFVPHVNFTFVGISSAIALLGATISPYTMFWQVQGEKEEARTGTSRQQMRGATLDVAIGVISGNLVSYFIIVCTAATLFTQHKSVTTAADAARALEPLLGPAAKYLFSVGFIGAGLIAIPVLLASTSYAVAGTFGWPLGLSKKPWQSEGFYLILTAAIIMGVVIALLHFDPIQLIFWSNVLGGILAPVLIIFLLVVGNNRKIMRDKPLSRLTNITLVLTCILMIAAAALLFYGMFTGQR